MAKIDFLYDRDFREVLRRELEKRQASQPRYSMRAFARDLKLRQTTFIDMMNERSGLPPFAASTIAANLHMNEKETAYFCDLVAIKYARSTRQREVSQKRLEAHWSPSLRQMSNRELSYLSNYRYPVILELIGLLKQRATVGLIAEGLGVATGVIEEDLRALAEIGVLTTIDGHWVRSPDFEIVTGDRPVATAVIRSFHRQVLEKAIGAIESQAIDERKFLSVILTTKKSRVAEARNRLEEIFNSFIKEFHESEGDIVYAASFQFFRGAKDV